MRYEARARQRSGAAGTVPDPVAGPAAVEAAAAVAATQAVVANSPANAPMPPRAQSRLCESSLPCARTSCQTRAGGRGGRPGAGPCVNLGSRVGVSQVHHLSQSRGCRGWLLPGSLQLEPWRSPRLEPASAPKRTRFSHMVPGTMCLLQPSTPACRREAGRAIWRPSGGSTHARHGTLAAGVQALAARRAPSSEPARRLIRAGVPSSSPRPRRSGCIISAPAPSSRPTHPGALLATSQPATNSGPSFSRGSLTHHGISLVRCRCCSWRTRFGIRGGAWSPRCGGLSRCRTCSWTAPCGRVREASPARLAPSSRSSSCCCPRASPNSSPQRGQLPGSQRLPAFATHCV